MAVAWVERTLKPFLDIYIVRSGRLRLYSLILDLVFAERYNFISTDDSYHFNIAELS
jgi:hypothetical protein